MVELQSISKIYKHPESGIDLPVLSHISLLCEQGETLAITGPSGSGKTTLLNIIGGLDAPTSGQILHLGRDISQLGEKDLAEFRNQHIGFVFQQHHLLPQLSVLENILLPTLINPADKNVQQQYAETLLERVGLKERQLHVPAQLSGGEQQRVAVVRALVNKPHVLLADEPTGSLDQKNSDTLAELLVELNKELNTSLIVVTHSPNLAAKMHKKFNLIQGVLEE